MYDPFNWSERSKTVVSETGKWLMLCFVGLHHHLRLCLTEWLTNSHWSVIAIYIFGIFSYQQSLDISFHCFCFALLVYDLPSGCWCSVWSSPARPACPPGPSRWWRRPGGRSGAARSRCRWPGCLLAWAPWEQSPSPSPSLKHERVKRVTWTPSLFVVKDLLSQLPSLLPTFLFSFAFIFSVTLSEVWEWKEN